jgi:hypothetical protein
MRREIIEKRMAESEARWRAERDEKIAQLQKMLSSHPLKQPVQRKAKE